MITPLGATARECAEAWRAGRRAPRTRLTELAGTRLANAEVAVLPQFDAGERLGSRRMLKFMSEAAVLGCVAAREAAEDAHLKQRFPPERVGLYAATGMAAASVQDVAPMIQQSIDETGRFSCRRLGERGLAAANPLLSFKILANMPPCLVSILEGIKGPSFIFTPWEGQTGAALREAWRAVADGEVDCALAGAADNPAHPASFVYLSQVGLLRHGECPAPAAAYLVMERAETARRDGRQVYARIATIEVANGDGAPCDPLAERIGRTFAAAPAVLLALACCAGEGTVRIRGVDHEEFRAELRPLA
jgi:3-oxoacyl-(acyl-carrier-protein) synthase